MKNVRQLLLWLVFAASMGISFSASAQSSQQWNESGVGSFDAIGLKWVSGGNLANPALTFDSGATGWAAIGNSLNAFATFDSTTSVNFTSHLLSEPGTYIFYAWNGSSLVDSALVSAHNLISFPYAGGAPTREAFALSAAPIPEPETYAMLLAGLGLIGSIARRRKNKNA